MDIRISGVAAVPMDESHLDHILRLMNQEGWYYYDHHELQRYLNLGQDCVVLLKQGEVIGCLFTTNYGNQAWLGNIVVAAQERGKGLAGKMIRGMTGHLHRTRGIRTFRLGSVPLAIGLYKRVGFRAESFTTAQAADLPIALAGVPDSGKEVALERLASSDLAAVARMDARYFKSDRLALIRQIFQDAVPGSCWCIKAKEDLAGFIMARQRKMSKDRGGFAQGPDQVFRLGPCCVLPEYGIEGFKALFHKAIEAVNQTATQLEGQAKIYTVFPRNADRETIYKDTRDLAAAMGLGPGMDLDRVFDGHEAIFKAVRSGKDDALWDFMQGFGFCQEYFEQVMCYVPGEPPEIPLDQSVSAQTRADAAGLFAAMTPGDKA